MINLMKATVLEPIAGFSFSKSQICKGRKTIINRNKPNPPKLLKDGIISKIPIIISKAPETTLARGFGINEGIGYRHFASNNYVNFSVGLNFSQYRLEDARPIFFPTGELGGTRRWGNFFGVSFGWFFPIYKRAPNKAYYY